jgi:uncharacterized membrane protein
MQDFAIALAVFIALHVGLSATGLRQALVGRIGEQAYRGLFSVASVAALVWVVMTYGPARLSPDNTLLYVPPSWAIHATHGIMLIAFLLLVPGLLTPGPTMAGFEGSLTKPEPAKGVHRITRHPFLWGVALWGAAHLISNGDRASVMLFGGLGLMVLLGTRSIDRKMRLREPVRRRHVQHALRCDPAGARPIGFRGALGAACGGAFGVWSGGLFPPPDRRRSGLFLRLLTSF